MPQQARDHVFGEPRSEDYALLPYFHHRGPLRKHRGLPQAGPGGVDQAQDDVQISVVALFGVKVGSANSVDLCVLRGESDDARTGEGPRLW
jgi:hypothetical protein